MLTCVEIYWLCCLSIEFPSFAHIFFSFVSLSFVLAKRLIRLKNITRVFWKFDYSEKYFFNLVVHAFRYPRGYENEGLGGLCESDIGKPRASVGDESGPNITPSTLCASYLMPETGVLVRTNFAEGQVPDCTEITCA